MSVRDSAIDVYPGTRPERSPARGAGWVIERARDDERDPGREISLAGSLWSLIGVFSVSVMPLFSAQNSRFPLVPILLRFFDMF